MAKEIPLRSQVAESDKWDLSSLYPCDEAWANDLKRLQTSPFSTTTFRISPKKNTLYK